jgi:tetratricopeptide (TPR) repeat protein
VRTRTWIAGLLACAWAFSPGRGLPPDLDPLGVVTHAQSGADTRLLQAARAFMAGDTDRAGQLATDYLGAHPGDTRARILLARVHLGRNELTAAYDQLERALAKDPRNVDALYYLGLVAGDLAATEFQRLHDTAPDSARVHQLRAETFEAQQRRSDAEREYEAALRQDPSLVDALLGLARLKRIRLACEDAVALYERAEAIRSTFDGAYGLGICLSTLQDDRAAVARFQQALRYDGRSAVALAGLGTSLVKIGQTANGINRLERAVAIQPNLVEAHYMLGMAYRTAGQKERSDQAFRKAEQLRAGAR